MTIRLALGAVVLAACGCGRVLGADFDLPEDPGISLGDSCSADGVLSCGPGRIVALCASGEWTRAFECPTDEHCVNKPNAECIANEIDCSASKGVRKCVGTTSVSCADDGNVAETTDCPGPCVDDGECRSVVDMALGSSSSCALLSDETVWCWGANDAGQLGHGTNVWSQAPTVPSQVVGLTGVEQLASADSYVCARKKGDVLCWGLDPLLSTDLADYHPEPVALPSPAVEVVARGNAVCVRMQSGDVYCWGSNDSGKLCSPEDSQPRAIRPAFAGATALYMGWGDTCARFDDGRLECCGQNDFAGNLQHFGVNDVPKKLDGVPAVQTASIGAAHMCISDTKGDVYCWGRNSSGELCLGHAKPVSSPELSFQSDVTVLALSDGQTLALDEARNLTCCGAACPIEGLGPTTPTPFRVLTHVTSITVSGAHQCAVLSGRPLCWGSNDHGEIRSGDDQTVQLPTLAGW